MEFKILINRWRVKRVGFLFKTYTWEVLCERNNIDIHELDTLDEKTRGEELLYSAYLTYCLYNKKKVKYTKEQIISWSDKMSKADSEHLAEMMLNSKIYGKTIREWEGIGKQQVKKK